MRGALFPVILLACGLAACGQVWNDPYPVEDRGGNTLYTFFLERPKHLDPAQSYVSGEYDVIPQIYEPPLQYHYLKRPYELIPAAANEIPKPRLFHQPRRRLSPDSPPKPAA